MDPMPEPVKRRPYDDSSRRARSEATRIRILDAAEVLVLDVGYRAATIADIARDADVHVDTVYHLVGRKPVVMQELVERAISGVDHAVDAEDREYVIAIHAEPDAARKLTIYAAATRAIQERLAPLMAALRDAASTDADAKDLWQRINDRRAANMVELAGEVEAAGGLRAGLTVAEAADVIWATNSAELFLLLTTERDWSPDRYETWLADAWVRLLLPGPSPSARAERPTREA